MAILLANNETVEYRVGEEIGSTGGHDYKIGGIRMRDNGIIVIDDEDGWPRINVLNCTVMYIALSAGGVN
jgi:hypothetical protein